MYSNLVTNPPTYLMNKPTNILIGWAGYTFARALDPNKYERIIISPRSYFVFTPLLASTAVGTLEFRTTLEPIRRLGRNVSVRFYQGWADDIDFDRKTIRIEENGTDDLSGDTFLSPPQGGAGEGGKKDIVVGPSKKPRGPMTDVPYDKLVIAVGAYSQTFGIKGVREYAHFLRDIGDARRIRLRVLSLFEQCTSSVMDDETRRRLLHFAIVGGGPTGIEFAAELHDLIHEDLSRIYPALMPHIKITVYDISPKILPMFDQTLATYATGLFRRQGINVKTGHSIQSIRPIQDGSGGLNLKIKEYGDEEVGAGIVVWSTGLMQNPLVEKLMGKTISAGAVTGEGGEAPERVFQLDKDPRTGSILTDDRFRAQLIDKATTTTKGGDNITDPSPAAATATAHPAESGVAGSGLFQTQTSLPDVFVIGDCAMIDRQAPLPKTAQVASQQAAYLAKALNKGTLEAKPFRFHNWGTMTYLGNWKAIHQSSADRLTGWAAWVLWRTAYLTRCMSLKNKVLVPVYVSVSPPHSTPPFSVSSSETRSKSRGKITILTNYYFFFSIVFSGLYLGCLGETSHDFNNIKNV